MKKSLLKQGFSSRLGHALIANGKFSARSATGVSIKALAVAAGCSITMAKKYVDGNSLPEIESLTKIAQWLNVSPEWLLHGQTSTAFANSSDLEDKELLKFIFFQAKAILNSNDKQEINENIDFVIDIYHQTRFLQCLLEEKKRIASWMIDSLTKLKEKRKNHHRAKVSCSTFKEKSHDSS